MSTSKKLEKMVLPEHAHYGLAETYSGKLRLVCDKTCLDVPAGLEETIRQFADSCARKKIKAALETLGFSIECDDDGHGTTHGNVRL